MTNSFYVVSYPRSPFLFENWVSADVSDADPTLPSTAIRIPIGVIESLQALEANGKFQLISPSISSVDGVGLCIADISTPEKMAVAYHLGEADAFHTLQKCELIFWRPAECDLVTKINNAEIGLGETYVLLPGVDLDEVLSLIHI